MKRNELIKSINHLLTKCDTITLEAIRNTLASILNDKMAHANPESGTHIPFKM